MLLALAGFFGLLICCVFGVIRTLDGNLLLSFIVNLLFLIGVITLCACLNKEVSLRENRSVGPLTKEALGSERLA